MTHYFGNQSVVEGKNFPETPFMVNVLDSKRKEGVEVLTGKPWAFIAHAVKVTYNTDTVGQFNNINPAAVGVEATAQSWRKGDSNMMVSLKKIFPKATITHSSPAPGLVEYEIYWSEQA